jgi:hypothetical protein
MNNTATAPSRGFTVNPGRKFGVAEIVLALSVLVLVVMAAVQLHETDAVHESLLSISGPRWREIDLAAKAISLAGENASVASNLFLTTSAEETARLVRQLDENGRRLAEIERDVEPTASRCTLGGKPAFTVDSFIEDYKQHGIIETKTFTYMRGRTISDSLVIVDEAQEITPHLAKLMLTRAGFGSKFVFLGDPTDSQIDNLLVDSRSNGLVYTIEKMKPYTITGHISLNKVERSPLAQIAEKCM